MQAYLDRSAPVAPIVPRNEPTTHQVAHGDTFDGIADQYGVTPQALREANPDLFRDKWRQDEAQQAGRSDPIFYGDVLNIPAAPLSVTRDPIQNPHEANHGSTSSEYTFATDNLAITHSPGDGMTRGTVKSEAGFEGLRGIEFKMTREASLEVQQKSKDGYTEFTVTGGYVTMAGVSAQRGIFEGEVAAGVGMRVRYKVIVPGDNQSKEMVAGINPFDPSTVPPGATVIVDHQNYRRTDAAGSVRHIGSESQIIEAEGMSFSVSRAKDGGSVQVMIGPSSALENYGVAGLRIKKAGFEATVAVGAQVNVGESKVHTATFDLKQPGAATAFNGFLAHGELPADLPGVSDVATVQRLDLSQQGRMKIKLAGMGAELEADLAINPPKTGTCTKTTYPDGSFAVNTEVKYGDNVPLSVTQRFDVQGNEIRSERTYEFSVDTGGKDNQAAKQINWVASGGDSDRGDAVPGKTVRLVFTEAQMRELSRKAEKAGDTLMPNNDIELLAGDGDGNTRSTWDFAMAMARNNGQDSYGFANSLLEISDAADGNLKAGTFVAIDMQVISK